MTSDAATSDPGTMGDAMATDSRTAPLRADAERNRRRLIDAAAEIFNERGIDASIAEIRERAGVGQGTVFRHFPTKEHLIAAVMRAPDAAIDGLLRRAQADGSVRDDVAAEDILLLEGAASHAGSMLIDVAPELWRRYLDLIFDGMRPAGAHPLSHPAPTAEQFDQLKVGRAPGGNPGCG
jgi:AcrR family transcriptional regulator